MNICKKSARHIQELGLNVAQIDALNAYEALLIKWQKSINLIAPSTIDDIWMRHIIDSAQLFNMLDRCSPKALLDLGSGGGFPAIVIAILDKHAFDNSGMLSITCLESVQKKCAFLKDVSRQLGLKIKVNNMRIESFSNDLYEGSSEMDKRASRETYGLSDGFKYHYITARALASLDKLLEYSLPFFENNVGEDMVNISTAFFLKGQDIDKELTDATKCWHIDYEMTDSITHNFGKIITINDFSPIE